MLAVLLLNRMSMKRRTARKQRLAKPAKVDVVVPEVFVCRTCLSPDNLESIFVNKDSEKKRSHDLKLVTGLEIKMNDGLSQKICSKCIETMNTALQFRRTSRKAEKSLLNSVTGKKSKKKYKLHKKVVKTKLKEAKKEKLDSDLDVGNDFQNNDCGTGGDDCFQDYSYQNNEYHNDDDNFVPVKEEVTETKAETKPTEKKKRPAIPNAPSYKCSTCNKEFRMKATYQSHMRFHTNYCVCEACGKRCRNNNQLQEHKRARHGLGRIHKCAYCEYSAATKEALTIHERRHTGERPYVCDHCGATFHRRSNLVQHIAIHLQYIHERRHTGERPYVCDHCGATFHRRSNLVQHIAIHLPEKNFQCDLCPKRLKSRKFLQIHKHNAHTGRRYGYLCAVCERRFEKPNKVRAHSRRVHGLPDDQQGPVVRCSMCDKREKSKKLLQVHQYKVHRLKPYKYVCPVCRDVFSRPGNVRQHLTRSHGVLRIDQGKIERLEVQSSVLPEIINHKLDYVTT